MPKAMVIDDSKAARTILMGANEYMTKPFTEEIIADKLRLLGVLG